MVSARDIYAKQRKLSRKERLELNGAMPVVKKLVKQAVKEANPDMPVTDKQVDSYAETIVELAAQDVEADLAAKPEPSELAEYEDQEREFEGIEESGEGGNEARGLLQDFNTGHGKYGLASLTSLETRDHAGAMMELRILARHYPGFGIEDIPEWLDAYAISIGRGGRKETTDVLRGNVPIAPPPGQVGPPRW